MSEVFVIYVRALEHTWAVPVIFVWLEETSDPSQTVHVGLHTPLSLVYNSLMVIFGRFELRFLRTTTSILFET